MSILNKPAAGAYALNAAAALAPDSLFMLDEGSGTSLVNKGKDAGSHDGTINGADWAIDAGRAYLAFVSADSDYAIWDALGITTSCTVVVILRIPSDNADVDVFVSIADSSVSNSFDYGQVSSGQSQVVSRAGATTDPVNYGGAGINDDAWHMHVLTFQGNQKEGSIDGAAKTTSTTSFALPTVDSMRIGSTADSSPSNFLEGDVAGVLVYKNTILSNAQIASLWNSGDPWSKFLSYAVAPTVATVGPGDFGIVFEGETGVEIDGANFGATTGHVYATRTGELDGSEVELTVTAWTDSKITITLDSGYTTAGPAYLHIVHNDGSEADPFEFELKLDDPVGVVHLRTTPTTQNAVEGESFTFDCAPYFYDSGA